MIVRLGLVLLVIKGAALDVLDTLRDHVEHVVDHAINGSAGCPRCEGNDHR